VNGLVLVVDAMDTERFDEAEVLLSDLLRVLRDVEREGVGRLKAAGGGGKGEGGRPVELFMCSVVIGQAHQEVFQVVGGTTATISNYM
jgi:hypothetical protein